MATHADVSNVSNSGLQRIVQEKAKILQGLEVQYQSLLQKDPLYSQLSERMGKLERILSLAAKSSKLNMPITGPSSSSQYPGGDLKIASLALQQISLALQKEYEQARIISSTTAGGGGGPVASSMDLNNNSPKRKSILNNDYLGTTQGRITGVAGIDLLNVYEPPPTVVQNDEGGTFILGLDNTREGTIHQKSRQHPTLPPSLRQEQEDPINNAPHISRGPLFSDVYGQNTSGSGGVWIDREKFLEEQLIQQRLNDALVAGDRALLGGGGGGFIR